MKVFILIITSLSFSTLYAQQKQRFIENPQDKKYLFSKVNEIMTGLNIRGKGIRPKSGYILGSDTFGINFNTQSVSNIKVNEIYEKLAFNMACVFKSKLLKEFPKYHFFTLTFTDKTKQQVSLTCHYTENNEVEYYSIAQQKVVTARFTEDGK